LSLLDRQSARVHRLKILLAEVLPAGVLLSGVLLVAKEETALAVSELLEKTGTILQGSVTLEGEEALLFSYTSLVIWYSWGPFSLLGCTGGHQQSFWYFWSLPICQCAVTTMEVL